MLLAGRRGHLSNLKWKDFSLLGETQLKDKISDAIYLVDHTMTAVAQKKYVYMYTKEGTEMHILSKLSHMDRLGYLYKHMLLVGASSSFSVMRYVDISTGQDLGHKEPAIMRDPTSSLAVNPTNGVVATADLRGVVKLWSPSVVDPLVQLKSHKGVIDAICFHPNGRFWMTLGGDHKLKIWDARTLRTLEEYAVTYAFNTMDISSSGLVALGGGTNVHIWRDMFSKHKPRAPYMKFSLGYGNVAEQAKFCPFEDVLGVGHSQGFTSFLVPGSGEANPDFYYANPHETERHRQDRVVANLLDKLPPDTVSMDIQVPGVNEDRLAAYKENLRLNRKAAAIREKKQRRADRGAEEAPTGLLVGTDEEVDEDLGYKERPRTRELKTRLEKLKENKKRKWDKKDSGDKVRSKQTMRASRAVQRQRAQTQHDAIHGAYDRDNLTAEERRATEEEERQHKRDAKRRRAEREDIIDDIRYLQKPAREVEAQVRRGRTGSSASSGGEGGKPPAKASAVPAAPASNAAFKRFL
ncbi:U3 small nucleolar RNA-associated protein 7 [Strigomonas culicis]|uniref:U3 small nucleolar RNA-associated protein 7 n=1 Tax=Strigomonas culicis TaxID=28005 RepID=S9V3I0_9TRYP|nr:U3 small nucleolar RNA-associated protein 7 [Strigomonas culicis]|eukprot:EPY21481.1 U3 small nucleolar RNA-associated protein 7 [Strigomonas culicis]